MARSLLVQLRSIEECLTCFLPGARQAAILTIFSSVFARSQTRPCARLAGRAPQIKAGSIYGDRFGWPVGSNIGFALLLLVVRLMDVFRIFPGGRRRFLSSITLILLTDFIRRTYFPNPPVSAEMPNKGGRLRV